MCIRSIRFLQIDLSNRAYLIICFTHFEACGGGYYDANAGPLNYTIQADCRACPRGSYSLGSVIFTIACPNCPALTTIIPSCSDACDNRGCFSCPFNYVTDIEGATSVDMCGKYKVLLFCPKSSKFLIQLILYRLGPVNSKSFVGKVFL